MRFSFLHRALCALAIVSAATPAAAAPCTSGSVESYVVLGATGCTIDSLRFANFAVETFPGPTAQQIPPRTLSIAPLSGGFSLFSDNILYAAEGDLLGFRLLFDVLGSSLVGGTVALGSNRMVEGDGVLTALLDAGGASTAIALVIDGFDDATQSFSSAATTHYAAFLELGVDGGTMGSARLGSGLASVTFSSANVTPIPEPETVLLTLSGLVLVIARTRRTRLS